MVNSLNIISKILYRSKKNTISFGILFVVTFYVFLQLHKTEISTMDFLTSCLGMGICGFIYFTFISYENITNLRLTNGQEYLDVFENSELYLKVAQLLILGIPLFLWSLSIYLWQLFDCYSRGIFFGPYIWHCLLAVILYCVFPSYIGILLGLCLEKLQRSIASGIIFVAALLYSNILSTMFSGSTLLGIPIASVLDWFAISVPNLDWLADPYYGISMERSRWILTVFWIFIITDLLLLQLIRKSKKIVTGCLGMCLILTILCGTIFSCRGGDCVVIKDSRPDGVVMDGFKYYGSQKVDEIVPIPADFSIIQYDMDVEIHNTMTVTAKIHTTGNVQHYRFTLFHGYQIEYIESENGSDIPYERMSDYIDIRPTDDTAVFIIRYSGDGGKYFANNQGVCLPGYFAWYPVPGYQKVWDYDNGSYYVNTDYSETDFRVSVNCKNKVFSNISDIGNNSFAGVSDTVSLYAGLAEEKNINGTRYIYSPMRGQQSALNLKEIENTWESICEMTGISYSLSLKNKTIIVQPTTIVAGLSSQMEQAVILKDQILLCNFKPTEADIILSMLCRILPDRDDTVLLRSVFLDKILSENTGDVFQKPDYEMLNILKRYNSAGEITDIEEWRQYSDAEAIVFYDLFNYQLNQCGREYVFNKVYQYLTSEDHMDNQVDFLYYLDGERHD